jgi:hypothetical protein
MTGAVFLSAGVPPDPTRRGHDTADPYLIREAVSAFIEVVLGRRLIVWGGQPAITPMIWAAAAALRISYEECVVLYQSELFHRDFPKENEKFQNVVVVPQVGRDRNLSLTRLREVMLGSRTFEAGVFIGGSDGLFEELAILKRSSPQARIVALPSPGGVAAEIFEEHVQIAELRGAIDFAPWLYDLLAIRPSEQRLNSLLPPPPDGPRPQ